MLNKEHKDYKIYAVDDVQDFLDSLKRTFMIYKKRGYGFIFGSNNSPKDALNHLSENVGISDILLLDYELGSGYDAKIFLEQLENLIGIYMLFC